MPQIDPNNSLCLFSHIPVDTLSRPFVLSSLQDFEASLFLISRGKWPASHVLLWSACEKMIKAGLCVHSPITNHRHSARDLQDLSAVELLEHYNSSNKRLTPQLFDASHKLRVLRNHVSHKGASPEDDLECLEAFFRGGASFYESTIQFATGKNIQEHLTGSSQWFWSIYSHTRKALFLGAKTPNNEDRILSSLFYFVRAIDKVERTKMAVKFVNPAAGYIYHSEEFEDDAQEALWKSRNEAESSIQEYFESNGWDCVRCDGGRIGQRNKIASNTLNQLQLECPLCGSSDGIIAYSCKKSESSGKMLFKELEAYCCMNASCVAGGEVCTSIELVRIVFEDKITPENKETLARNWGFGSAPTEP